MILLVVSTLYIPLVVSTLYIPLVVSTLYIPLVVSLSNHVPSYEVAAYIMMAAAWGRLSDSARPAPGMFHLSSASSSRFSGSP